MTLPTNFNGGLNIFNSNVPNFLTDDQLNRLSYAFQQWYDDKTISNYRRFLRGRHWLVFLILRFSGARISEVTNIKLEDIDYRNSEIRLITLKRRKKKAQYRIIPMPTNVIAEISSFMMFAQRDVIKSFKSTKVFNKKIKNLFAVYRNVFYTIFQDLSEIAGIPKELAHPHILRHTRAIELLRAGVPITIVQDLLGHSALTTTAIYLKMSGQEMKSVLKEKGLI